MTSRSVAIAGSGRIAASHIDAVRAAGGRVGYVVGSDLARASALAERAGGAIGTTELMRALDDRSVIGVIVCGQSLSHGAVATRAAGAGKHVLVEKPPGLTVEELDAAAAAAATAGVTYMVAQVVRFHPVVARILQEVAAGAIGRARLLNATWHAGYVWPGGWRAWQLDARRSGGILVHNGMHGIDLAIALIGSRPERVFSRAWRTFAPDTPIQESFHLTLRFDDSALAMLETSYGLARSGDAFRRLLVAGTAATLVHSTDQDPGLRSPSHDAEPLSVAGAMRAQARHWLQVLSGEVEPAISVSESRAALETAIAAQQSLETGRAVHVGAGP